MCQVRKTILKNKFLLTNLYHFDRTIQHHNSRNWISYSLNLKWFVTFKQSLNEWWLPGFFRRLLYWTDTLLDSAIQKRCKAERKPLKKHLQAFHCIKKSWMETRENYWALSPQLRPLPFREASDYSSLRNDSVHSGRVDKNNQTEYSLMFIGRVVCCARCIRNLGFTFTNLCCFKRLALFRTTL